MRRRQSWPQPGHTLLAASRAVTGSLDLDRVVEEAVEAIRHTTEADTAEIWTSDANQAVHCVASRGLVADATIDEVRAPAGGGYVGAVIQRQDDLLLTVGADSPFGMPDHQARSGVGTLKVLRLRHHDSIVGVMSAGWQRAPPPEVVSAGGVLDELASIVAGAVANCRAYVAARERAVMDERIRISEDLHSDLAQLGASMQAQTSELSALLAAGDIEHASSQAIQLARSIERLGEQVRSEIHALRLEARPGGLADWLRASVDELAQSSGIDVRTEGLEVVERISLRPEVEVGVFRIAQEALQNARKHARSLDVELVIAVEGAALRVTILDRGVGFETERTPDLEAPRFGLEMMRQRAARLGAELTVQSVPGQGTRVTVVVEIR